MPTVVIVGSTRGIGLGLAREFLARGCQVMISGRGQAAVDEAVAQLAAGGGGDRVAGQPCDVTRREQVQALWDAARARWGRVDIWINNAGIGHDQAKFWELTPERVAAVVDTNILGLMVGCQVAIVGMLAQGGGYVYNMEGFGSDGRVRAGMSVYGSTKSAIHYLTKALVEEVKGTPVKVGSLSPGMVLTNLLTDPFQDDPEGFERAKKAYNMLADRVETVTPFLVEKMLANKKSGARIQWLTPRKLLTRVALAPFRKRNIFRPDDKLG